MFCCTDAAKVAHGEDLDDYDAETSLKRAWESHCSLEEPSIAHGCHFPMYTMDVAAFLELETMHPDPTKTQLRAVQSVLRTIMRGDIKELFASESHWRDYAKANIPFSTSFFTVGDAKVMLTPEELAEEALSSQVWLDFACVPQSAENIKQRLSAIDSIPWYIDHALNFFVVVPRVEHSDLPGVRCDYHSWRSRGWCRLEEQVQELSVVPHKQESSHRRPLVVHSERCVCAIDAYDYFYMYWQRGTSIFTGEFSCCRLGHKAVVVEDGVERTVAIPCDKERIRPMVASLWDRKIRHIASLPLEVNCLMLWRWVSHRRMMLADEPGDSPANDDPSVQSLCDVVKKYFILVQGKQAFLDNMAWQLDAHVQMSKLYFDGPQQETATLLRMIDQWRALLSDPDRLLVQLALLYVGAEGNARMVRRIHKEHNADLHLCFPWGMSLFQFTCGKGHVRVVKYILENGGKQHVNDKSPREGICAFDRACKAGFVELMHLLIEYGAEYLNVARFNGQTPAHGAAMFGHVPVLRELQKLGCDLHAKSLKSETPLEAARSNHQNSVVEFLTENL
ncbi:hypothetical protein AB1Y20_004892 [Prymnesium parvum]|uniref:Uncharacterized protein n=1 Tax=Prymnesium parvum TaxID=97485 RepID=A0AB34J070_PRYPA